MGYLVILSAGVVVFIGIFVALLLVCRLPETPLPNPPQVTDPQEDKGW